MPVRVTPIKGRSGWYEAKGTVKGQRIRRRYEARSRAEANAIAKRLEQDAWDRDPDASPVSFEMCALAYMEAGKPNNFLAPLIVRFRGRDVNTIKPGEIQDAARAIYPTAKPDTQNRQGITPAQAIINHAADRGLCPPIRVKKFSVQKPKRRAVDRAWLDAFMANAEPHIAALALFMFTTAARLSEALRVTWDEADLQAGTAHIAKTKMGPARDAILTTEMVAVLASLEDDTETLFRHPVKCGEVYRQWRAACDRAGIDYVPPHQAGRHSFATEMVTRNGVDAVTAADIGGYSVRVLQETYAHPEGQREALEGVMGRGKTIRRVK